MLVSSLVIGLVFPLLLVTDSDKENLTYSLSLTLNPNTVFFTINVLFASDYDYYVRHID